MPSFANVHQLSEFLDYVEIGLRGVFEDTLPAHPKTYGSWLKEVKAKDLIENYIVISGLGTMPAKTPGGNFQTDKKISSSPVDFELTSFGLSVVLEYELVQWDKYDVFDNMSAELAKSAQDRYNVTAYAILNNAFSSSDTNYTIYNGEAIFNTAHARLDGGTWKNRPTTETSLSYIALQQGRVDLATLVNERGRYVRTSPKVLIVSEDNRWIAETIIQSSGRPGTADNDKNTLSEWGLSIHSSPYLTSSTAYFLTGNKDDVQIMLRTGIGPEYRQDYDRNNWNVLMQCYQSLGVAVLHSQGWWGSDGA